ncbi:enoyl-CoA hydratase/isomerase family protein [Actinoplanes sp. NPDC048796]|uniref:enoyl-CoA hydratase/isomerase family protein n=1 Tax=unclassified Actinoplanes TaxID=2626549 RepID=UPI00340C52EB
MTWNASERGPVALLTFDNPPDGLMSFAGLLELGDLLETYAEKPADIKLIVLTGGAPGLFINHADLAELAKLGAGTATERERGAWSRALRLLEEIPQPAIAAIDGLASGGGHELALACTLRVGSPDARLQQPEVPAGFIPGGGGSVRLPRLIGPGLAADVILTGREVGASEALRVGWLSRVFSGSDFLTEVLAWADSIAAAPAPALAAAKKSIVQGSRLPFGAAQAQERELFSGVLAR